MAILCPNCHRPFTKELEKEDPIIQTEQKGEKIDAMVTSRASNGFLRGMENDVSMGQEHSVPVAEVTYEEHYKCKHCGYEWTEVKEKSGVVDNR